MSLGIEEFLKSIPGTKDKNFDMGNTISPYGDWTKLEGVPVVIRRILNQLLISRGTYIFDPTYGESILRFLFEPVDAQTQTQIKATIDEVINQNKGSYNISSEVLYFKDKKGFRISIIIEENGVPKKISLDIDESLLRD